MNNGYIKLHRKILDNPIVMKDTECLAVWIYLLLNATHKEKSVMFKGKRIALKPGQLITGIISISKKMKINKDKVQRTLKLFENDKQIEQQTSNKNRLITIVNWGLYQDFDKQNDKQVINNCETTDKQVITNNNDKNERNIYSTTSTKNERIDACVCDDEDSISGRYGNKRNGDENLFEFVERHFGRTLSGAEYEHIEIWEDNELTRYAVKEAVLSGARSIKYVEKILERYKRENFKTVEDVQNSRNKFKKTSQLSQEEQEIFNYNWLEWKEIMKQLSIYDYEEVRLGVIPTFETRRASYESVDKAKRYRQIIEIMQDVDKPLTAKEIAVEMKKRGYSSTDERNVSAPRITELLEKGILDCSKTKVRCKYSGKMVSQFVLRTSGKSQ